jgi:hypothetical protein
MSMPPTWTNQTVVPSTWGPIAGVPIFSISGIAIVAIGTGDV